MRGWLLDAYIRGSQAILWMRTVDGKVVRILDSYAPDFYVRLKGGAIPGEMLAIIREHPHVLDASIERKYTSVTECRRSEVIHVTVDGARSFKGVMKDLERLGCIGEWFNVDITHIQRYLFRRGFAPTQKIEIDLDSNGCLRRASALDLELELEDGLEIGPPPFTSLFFKLEAKSDALTPNPEKDPISEIAILDEDLKAVEVIKGEEKEVLESFAKKIQSLDPDFIVAPSLDEVALPYLIRRAQVLGSDISLGREPYRLRNADPKGFDAFPGRVGLRLEDFLRDGLAGIVEKSLFSMAPPRLASKWALGRLIDSRQCYEALRREILIPRQRSPRMYGTTAKELVFKDRGALILSPIVGLHENVAVLDFESMFPNIIIKYNISYETVDPQGIDGSRQGFLGELTRRFLDRRLYFKHLRSKYPKGSREWIWCDQRQSALKGILVCIYGFSGCDMNRFGNVYAYAKVNEIARDILVRAIGICRSHGFRVLYADCDSVFVQKEGASKESYEELANRIQEELGLPIALDQHFKFLVLLKQEADPSIEAVRRYFGRLTSGELFFRGIELRRRDYPPFIKEFEARLMEILFDAKSAEDVIKGRYAKARDFVVKALEALASDEVPPEALVVTKMLRKPIESYSFLSPHVSAAIQMVQKWKRFEERSLPREGEPIEFIYVNAEHPNPLRRVMPAGLINSDHHYYDREKYEEMLLDASETILGWNGFSREELGYKPHKRNFLEDLRGEGGKEILREITNLETEN